MKHRAEAGQSLDLFEVVGKEAEAVEATGADVAISIRGSTLYFGRDALKRADEVRTFVDALLTAGLDDDAISFVDVTIGNNTTYRINVRCSTAELPKVLGEASTTKHCTVRHVAWRFGELRPATELLRVAAARAKATAAEIADELGVALDGIHRIECAMSGSGTQDTCDYIAEVTDTRSARRAGMDSVDLGIPLSHSGTRVATVKVAYRLGSFSQSRHEQGTEA